MVMSLEGESTIANHLNADCAACVHVFLSATFFANAKGITIHLANSDYVNSADRVETSSLAEALAAAINGCEEQIQQQ